MNCYECKYLMFDYIDNKLSEPARREMEQHMEQCQSCADRLVQVKAKQEEEKISGLFWYMFKPSGGFKRFFFIGAIFTFILVVALISVSMKNPMFSLF